MPRVKVFLKRVSLVVLPVAGLGAMLVRFPSLHNGLVPCEKRDWFASCSELNKRAQMGKDEWKPVQRLYPSLDFTKQKTHKLSAEAIQNEHFSHVFKTIEDEQTSQRLSRYIAKLDADQNPKSEFDGSEYAFCDGSYRAFLAQLRDTLADPVRFYSTVFGPILNVPNTEHFVSELKGLRIHYSLTDFAKDSANEAGAQGKPKVGVLLMNGWPSNANEWASFLETVQSSDRLKDCSVSPVFVTVSMPSMGTNLSEVAVRDNFGDFNLYSVAILMRQLMEDTLSDEFDQYVVLASDWGSLTAEVMCMSEGNSPFQSKSDADQKLKGSILACPIANPPVLELILMQNSPKWVDYFLKDEPDFLKEIYKRRGSDGPLAELGKVSWQFTWYQHLMNVRPHVVAHTMGADLMSYAAFVFEAYVRWSSMNKDTDDAKKREIFNQVISTVCMAYANPGGIEGGTGYYRENIAHGYLSLFLTQTPKKMPLYFNLNLEDPFCERSCDRALKMRYPGFKKAYRHPGVGHFPAVEGAEGSQGLVNDLFDTLEDLDNNLLLNPPKTVI